MDDNYRSSDDEDYVPEGALEDDIDEPSGDECEEVTTADDPNASKTGRGKRRKISKETKLTASTSPVPSADVDDFFANLISSDPYAIKVESTSKAAPEDAIEDSAVRSSVAEVKDSTTKITEVFDFAGQEIAVEKEVSHEEAKAYEDKKLKMEAAKKKPVIKRVGLGDALTMISKKPKMSILDKSNMDWKSFKQEQKIEEDLATHNRGKNGYLNKQDFLIKADHAQFEKEKAMRDSIRKQQQ